MRSVGLFSGIGGFELGLQRAGIDTELLCEYWEPAARPFCRSDFEPTVVGDIRELGALPQVDVVTAGFPCTDLSQVGRTAGIDGDESGLVREAFRLIEETPPTWVVLENVPNMLSLNGGAAMSFIADWFEEHGWNWAYRTVDSQHFGVRQRRRRVFLVASRTEDPRRRAVRRRGWRGQRSKPTHAAYGFYWTEGNRGLGWGDGVTPTLKGGSKLGIASPPGRLAAGEPTRVSASPGRASSGRAAPGIPSRVDRRRAPRTASAGRWSATPSRCPLRAGSDADSSSRASQSTSIDARWSRGSGGPQPPRPSEASARPGLSASGRWHRSGGSTLGCNSRRLRRRTVVVWSVERLLHAAAGEHVAGAR